MTNNDKQPPSIAIIGAGATGGLLAAHLTHAGFPVTLGARGESVKAIRREGLRVTDASGAWQARPSEVVDTDSVTRTHIHDVILVCVKTYDIDSILPVIDQLAGPDSRILSLQNGVGTDDVLAARYGVERCLSGALYVGAHRTSPHSISCTSAPRIILGPTDPSGDTDMANRVQAVFEAARVSCSVDSDIVTAKWQKFLFNCGLNPLTAVTGMKMRALFENPHTHGLFVALIREAAAAARAAGAPLADGAEHVAIETGATMDISSSMAEDLAAGRALEVDAFSGHVLALATAQGVPVPTTRTMHALLAGMSSRSSR